MTASSELIDVRDDIASLLERVEAMLARPADDLTELHRTTAIERVLEAESPLSPVQIARKLHEAGRDDRNDFVQVTTQSLWARGRIARVGYGLYASLSTGA